MVDMDTAMPRERDEESGKYTDAYADDEFLAALHDEDGVAGTSDLADAVGCTSRHALNRLRELEDAGQVTSKDVGRSLVWMLADDDPLDDSGPYDPTDEFE
jgi:GTP-sensing pleiotropic transcriptional regulator CodY